MQPTQTYAQQVQAELTRRGMSIGIGTIQNTGKTVTEQADILEVQLRVLLRQVRL